MEDIQLSLLSDDDLAQIDKWQYQYKDTPGLNAISWFILGGVPFYHLTNMLKNCHDRQRFGDDEYSLSLIAKNENEVVGAIIINMFHLKTKTPSLYIRDIFTHPEHQGEGVGKAMLTYLINNLHDFILETPKIVYANIDSSNDSSKGLFRHFGFEEASESFSDLKQYVADYQQLLENYQTKEKLS